MLLSNSDSNSDGKDKLIRFTGEFLLWPGFEWPYMFIESNSVQGFIF
jgi:hypothetical protein